MLLDTVSTEIFIRSLARSSNLSVVFFEQEDGQPFTDPVRATVHVARPRWHWAKDQYNRWLGAVCHELGHHRGNNGALMQYFVERKINTKSLYGTVVNILLDWINDAQWARYPGAHLAVQSIQEYCAQRSIEHVINDPPTEERSKLLIRVFSWIYGRRAATYQRGLMSAATRWEEIVPHEYSALNSELLELLSDTVGDRVDALARKIVDSDPETDEEEEEEGHQPGDEEEPGEEGEEGEEKQGSGGWISYRDVLMQDQDDHTDMGKPSRCTVKYDHDPSDSYVPFGDRYREIDLSEVVR